MFEGLVTKSPGDSPLAPKAGHRRYRHWKVTIFYVDNQRFSRVYTDVQKARKFAERQKKSPVVRTARVREVN